MFSHFYYSTFITVHGHLTVIITLYFVFFLYTASFYVHCVSLEDFLAAVVSTEP